MAKRSEGIRRIVFSFSVLFVIVIGGGICIIIVDEGVPNIELGAWFVFAGGLVIAYFIPQLISKVIYWVIDGFRRDKKI